MKTDHYETLTANLLSLINDESKHLQFKDFIRRTADLKNPITKNSYHGANVLNTLCYKLFNDFKTYEFITFIQAKDAKLPLKKGSKGCPVYYYQTVKSEDKKTKEEKSFPMIKRYTVFSLDCFDLTQEQKDKYCQSYEIDLDSVKSDNDKLEALKKLAKIEITKIGQAFYSPSLDRIHMPSLELFNDDLNFWNEVFLHELTHWTGHKKRLDRNLRGDQRSENYSKEELIAELGSFFLCLDLGIKKDLESGASYLRSYLKRTTSKDLFEAMNKAIEAIKYLYSQIGVI